MAKREGEGEEGGGSGVARNCEKGGLKYKEITTRGEKKKFDHAHLILRPAFELEDDHTSRRLRENTNEMGGGAQITV